MTGDLFTQAPAVDPIGAATRKGATFEQRQDEHGNHWLALAHRRGRPVALVSFAAPTKEAAAQAFCTYFNLKA